MGRRMFALTRARRARQGVYQRGATINTRTVNFRALQQLFTNTNTFPRIRPTIRIRTQLRISRQALSRHTKTMTRRTFNNTVNMTRITIPISPGSTSNTLVSKGLNRTRHFFTNHTRHGIYTNITRTLFRTILLTALPGRGNHNTRRRRYRRRTRILPRPQQLKRTQVFQLRPLVIRLLRILNQSHPRHAFSGPHRFQPITTHNRSRRLQRTSVTSRRRPNRFKLSKRSPRLHLVGRHMANLLARRRLRYLPFSQRTLRIRIQRITTRVVNNSTQRTRNSTNLTIRFFRLRHTNTFLLTSRRLQRTRMQVKGLPRPRPTQHLHRP